MKWAWALYVLYAVIVGVLALLGVFVVSESPIQDAGIGAVACAAALVPYLALSALDRALK